MRCATALLVIRNGDSLRDRERCRPRSPARIRGMMAVRDAVRLVFRTQLDDAPEERITEARQLLNDIYDSFVRRYGPLSSRENIGPLPAIPTSPSSSRSKTTMPRRKRATKTAIFERRTLERYKPVDACRDRRRSARHLAQRDRRASTGRAWSAHRPQPAGNCSASWAAWSTATRKAAVGNRRPLFERRRARESSTTAEAAAALDPVLRAQCRSAESRPARRSGAGRHQRPARLVVDSGKRHQGLHRASCSTSPEQRHASATAAPSPPGRVELDGGAKYNVSQHDDARHGALSRLRADRAGAQRPHADRLRRARGRTRVINQQETIAAREKQQQLKDRFREWIWQDERARRAAGPRLQRPLQQSAPAHLSTARI